MAGYCAQLDSALKWKVGLLMDSNESPPVGNEERDARIALLRKSICESFPSEPFTGKVTPVDGEWTPELDDEETLYTELLGRRWTDVPIELIRKYPSGLGLLTDQAFCAFLPAWLTVSLDDLDGENEVREFAVYMFGPERTGDSMSLGRTRRWLRMLNGDQRRTLRSILLEFSVSEPSGFIRAAAAEGLALNDELQHDAPNESLPPPPTG
jgi:hypothetical protein